MSRGGRGIIGKTPCTYADARSTATSNAIGSVADCIAKQQQQSYGDQVQNSLNAHSSQNERRIMNEPCRIQQNTFSGLSSMPIPPLLSPSPPYQFTPTIAPLTIAPLTPVTTSFQSLFR